MRNEGVGAWVGFTQINRSIKKRNKIYPKMAFLNFYTLFSLVMTHNVAAV